MVDTAFDWLSQVDLVSPSNLLVNIFSFFFSVLHQLTVPEVARLKRNWWIVHLISFVGGYSWTVMYSSLHQFVTTPTSIGEEDSVSNVLLVFVDYILHVMCGANWILYFIDTHWLSIWQ